MTDFWNRCEGQRVKSYPLEKQLGVLAASAVYATQYGEESRPAVIKLMQADELEWERRLTTWSAVSQLSHPNLIRLFEAGHCHLDGVPLLYVVMERADDSLVGALAERPLTAGEAREMLEAAIGALSYLHERGLAHGGIEPSSVMAVGEQIKLSSDSIAPVDDNHSPEADVWSLGVTLTQALTQRTPLVPAGASEPVIPENLPQPFFDIARECLRREPQARWTVSQIASRLRAPQLVPPRAAPPAKAPRSWVALYSIVIAMVAVISILFLLGRDRGPNQPPAPTAMTPVSAAVPRRSEQPRQLARAADVQPEPQKAQGNAPHKPGSWMVVAATYAQRKDAEKRARSITRKWPSFKAEVFAPAPEKQKPYYLVVLGSNLSDKSAAALQERARAAGVSRDAYITRFSR